MGNYAECCEMDNLNGLENSEVRANVPKINRNIVTDEKFFLKNFQYDEEHVNNSNTQLNQFATKPNSLNSNEQNVINDNKDFNKTTQTGTKTYIKTIQIKQFKLSNHMHLIIDFAKVTIYL